MKRLLFIVNVDWYFLLHWKERLQAVCEDGYEVHLIAGGGRSEVVEELEALGAHVHSVDLSRSSINPFSELRSVFQIAKLMRLISPDLVHAITIKPVLYGSVLASVLRIPFLGSFTGLGRLFYSNLFKMKSLRQIFRALLSISLFRQQALLTVENTDDLDVIRQTLLVGSERVRVLPGVGVDLVRFNNKKMNVDGKIRVLFGGRLYYDKGLLLLVEAVQQLKESGFDVDLYVAGIEDKSADNAISTSLLTSLDAQKRIFWCGMVEDMPKLIASMDIVCLPSLVGEGMPRILMEAASCSKASVASDVPGCRDAVDNGVSGLLVKPGDVEDLREKLRSLLIDPDKIQEMGKAARALAENRFDVLSINEKTLSMYDELRYIRKNLDNCEL